MNLEDPDKQKWHCEQVYQRWHVKDHIKWCFWSDDSLDSRHTHSWRMTKSNSVQARIAILLLGRVTVSACKYMNANIWLLKTGFCNGESLTEESSGLSKLHLSDIAPLQTEQKCKKQLNVWMPRIRAKWTGPYPRPLIFNMELKLLFSF